MLPTIVYTYTYTHTYTVTNLITIVFFSELN
jgi:hypothetical protein